MTAGALIAADAARVDITGTKSGITFEKNGKDSTQVNYAGWLKAKNQDTQYICSFKPVTDEWSVMEFSFTPDKDGKIEIQLAGQWAKEATDRNFVIFDDVEVNGVMLANGSFEDKDKQGKLKNWRLSMLATIVGEAKTGDAALKVNHDNRAIQEFLVQGGKSYTFKANVKKAPVKK